MLQADLNLEYHVAVELRKAIAACESANSGGAVAKNAPHRDVAVKFLEYLSSDEAQIYFANGNNEWPVVKSAFDKSPVVELLGKFKAENVPISTIGKNQIAAQKLLDRVGYK
jgi:iron(III) transport system substrate-binding protein